MGRAAVIAGGTWDAGLVERELGVQPLRVEPVLAPVLTVDGHIEPDATSWLREVHSRLAGSTATKTAESYADSLKLFTEFLLDRNTTLRGAGRQHIVAYVRHRTVDAATRVSGTTWGRERTAIKQFYEWLRETHRIELPFTVDMVPTPRGTVSSMREGRNVPKASAAGTPLEPPQIPDLIAAAWRVGPDGEVNPRNVTGARDAAYIGLGLACGGRADTLTHLTVYELPDPSQRADLVSMRLPGVISKSRREARVLAFRHHLQHVYDYANPSGGSRRLMLKGWTPQDPIRVAQVSGDDRFRGIVDTDGNRRRFNEMTAAERRRLVTPDGEPAMLFLSARDGAPLKYSAAEELTGDVSKLAEANAAARGGSFPHVHTHDLRHTYATHLAALFMTGHATGPSLGGDSRSHRVDVRSAVRMASAGLGHLDEGTTSLYIQQVGMMCTRYGVDDFLGKPR